MCRSGTAHSRTFCVCVVNSRLLTSRLHSRRSWTTCRRRSWRRWYLMRPSCFARNSCSSSRQLPAFRNHGDTFLHHFTTFFCCVACSVAFPLPANRRHPSSDDCLVGKRENYRLCSAQYCGQHLCSVQCTHMNRPSIYLLVTFSFSVVMLCVKVCLC